MIKQCEYCKNEFGIHTIKNRFCSRKCYIDYRVYIKPNKSGWNDERRKALSKKYLGSGNPMFGKVSKYRGKKRPEMSLKNNPNWKCGYWINEDGYKVIENSGVNQGRKILEHRLVMEQFLKRRLDTNELVHHKNGNKLDNRIENLELTTRSEHPKIHFKGVKRIR